MTISATRPRETFLGPHSTTEFGFSFRLDKPGDLTVIHTDAAGVETKLIQDTDYMVASYGASGGSVTYPKTGSPLPAGEKLTLLRVLDLTQDTDLENGGAYFAEVVEATFDRLAMQIQQVAEEVGRAVKTPPSSGEDPSNVLAAMQGERARAEAAAAAADGNAETARRWAEEAEGVPVAMDEFSAKHWAIKAEAQAQLAASAVLIASILDGGAFHDVAADVIDGGAF